MNPDELNNSNEINNEVKNTDPLLNQDITSTNIGINDLINQNTSAHKLSELNNSDNNVVNTSVINTIETTNAVPNVNNENTSVINPVVSDATSGFETNSNNKNKKGLILLIILILIIVGIIICILLNKGNIFGNKNSKNKDPKNPVQDKEPNYKTGKIEKDISFDISKITGVYKLANPAEAYDEFMDGSYEYITITEDGNAIFEQMVNNGPVTRYEGKVYFDKDSLYIINENCHKTNYDGICLSNCNVVNKFTYRDGDIYDDFKQYKLDDKTNKGIDTKTLFDFDELGGYYKNEQKVTQGEDGQNYYEYEVVTIDTSGSGDYQYINQISGSYGYSGNVVFGPNSINILNTSCEEVLTDYGTCEVPNNCKVVISFNVEDGALVRYQTGAYGEQIKTIYNR